MGSFPPGFTADRVEELVAQIRECFSDWWDVPDEEVEAFDHELIWLDPDSFRFLFPRFLIYSLENWEKRKDEAIRVPNWKYRLLHDFSISELELISEVYSEIERGGDKAYDWAQLWWFHQYRIEQIRQLARMQGRATDEEKT